MRDEKRYDALWGALQKSTIKVKDARQALLEATEQKIAAKEELLAAETGNILSGAYTASGKNEKEREAWLRDTIRLYRQKLMVEEREEREAILALELAKDERRNLENLLRIEELHDNQPRSNKGCSEMVGRPVKRNKI